MRHSTVPRRLWPPSLSFPGCCPSRPCSSCEALPLSSPAVKMLGISYCLHFVYEKEKGKFNKAYARRGCLPIQDDRRCPPGNQCTMSTPRQKSFCLANAQLTSSCVGRRSFEGWEPMLRLDVALLYKTSTSSSLGTSTARW